MKLNQSMTQELMRRLGILAKTQSSDPAFADLPALDWIALLAILAASILCVALISL